MIPKEAIEKAIEGGWKEDEPHIAEGCYETMPQLGPFHWKFFDAGRHLRRLSLADIALDPSFWQSLGKALGWNKSVLYHTDYERTLGGHNDIIERERLTLCCAEAEWHAHRFYDLILTNQNTKAFWNELLSANSNERNAPKHEQPTGIATIIQAEARNVPNPTE